ncbi:MAG: hypothetical protein EOM13_02035 [Clostridia bacterium]|nr:hypothetical protein [Eubacteriales bacterium]MDD3866649.1 hypothetical protein [Eubacteriales bacterium]MDD4461243.1 hypothetical protein [Eubacteriales bacterium]NCC47817.1 hypothetical protein [Clostridia bacterium]
MNSVFELIMLVCFGISWPFAALKSYRARSTKGKSLLFLIAIWIGYVSGILHKVLYSQDLVILVYIFNLTIVSLDLLLYVRNRRLEKQSDHPLV